MTQLWNRLVEIEQRHLAAYFAAMAQDTTVAAIDAEITAVDGRRQVLIEERKRLREIARRRVPTPEHDAGIAQLAAQLRELRAGAKAARKAAREALKSKLQELGQLRRDAVKRARQESGLWWATTMPSSPATNAPGRLH